MKPRILLSALLFASLGALAGCGGSSNGGGGGGTAKALYVSNQGSGNISGFTVGSSGSLSAISGSPFPETGSAPNLLAASGDTVYFTSSSPTGIGAAAIGSGGALSNVSLKSTGLIGGLAVTPDGTAVIVADRTNRTLTAYKAASGSVTAFGQATTTDTLPAAVVITPNAKFVYVINASIFSTISRFSYDASTGDLAPLTGNPTPFPAPGGVGDIEATRATIDRSGHFLIANSASGYIYVFTIGSDGSLTWTGQNVPVAPYNPLGGVAADPAGNFVYTVDKTTNKIYGFSIGDGGFMSPITGLPLDTGATPVSVAVDPSGTAVYVVNQGDNSVSGYAIGSGGALTAISGTFPVGSAPFDLAFSK